MMATAASARSAGRRVGVGAVVAFELRKLLAQRRTMVMLVASSVLPFLIVYVLEGQARPPKDTLFGRHLHDSGWSVPLLLLGFTSQWLLPLLASAVAGDIYAAEDHHGSWKTILTRSASRRSIFTGKAIVAIGFALTSYALLAMSTIAASVRFIGNQPLVGLTGQLIAPRDAAVLVVQSWVVVGAPLVGFTSVAMLLSVATRSIAIGVAAPVALGLVMQLVGALGGIDLIRPLLLTTPLEAWHGLFTEPAFSGPLRFGLAVSAVWSIACTGVAYVIFRNRDYQG